MSEDVPDPRQGAAGARPGGPTPPEGPRSLDPRSKGFWIPALIGVALMAVVWLGIKRIETNSGPWAIEAARTALSTSGLGGADRGAIEGELARLAGALDAGQVDARGVTRGVDAVLQAPLMQLLTLLDARDRMLPAAGLPADEAEAGAAALGTMASYVDAGLVGLDRLILALGPLATEQAPGSTRPMAAADELRAVIQASAAETEAVPTVRLEAVTLRDIDRAVLLADLEESIDGVLTDPGE